MNLVKVGNLGEFILTANQSSDILILLIICLPGRVAQEAKIAKTLLLLTVPAKWN